MKRSDLISSVKGSPKNDQVMSCESPHVNGCLTERANSQSDRQTEADRKVVTTNTEKWNTTRADT